MNPYKDILDSEKVLKTLVSEAKTMDNVKTRITELNVLIRLVNSFKEMLEKKYKTDYFDILLLSRMYHFFLDSDVYVKNEVPIEPFLYWLDQDVRLGREHIKKDIIGLLKGCQLYESLKHNRVEFDDDDVWDEVIEDTLIQVKKKIKFKEDFKT